MSLESNKSLLTEFNPFWDDNGSRPLLTHSADGTNRFANETIAPAEMLWIAATVNDPGEWASQVSQVLYVETDNPIIDPCFLNDTGDEISWIIYGHDMIWATRATYLDDNPLVTLTFEHNPDTITVCSLYGEESSFHKISYIHPPFLTTFSLSNINPRGLSIHDLKRNQPPITRS